MVIKRAFLYMKIISGQKMPRSVAQDGSFGKNLNVRYWPKADIQDRQKSGTERSNQPKSITPVEFSLGSSLPAVGSS